MLKETIRQFVTPVITALGYELWGLDYLIGKRGVFLRLYIDKKDGINIQDCEKVSHQVSALLDVEDVIPEAYRLEISSPGIPRPLFEQAHYVRYKGRPVRVTLSKPIEGRRTFMGTIESVDEDTVLLKIDGQTHSLPLSQIAKAYLTDE